MRRGTILTFALGACITATVACGNGGADARSSRSPAGSTTEAERRVPSETVVTSWDEQSQLAYHFARRPEVFYQRYTPDPANNAGYIVAVRLNRRLRRAPKKTGDDRPGGVTKGTLLLNGHGGGISPGLGTVSHEAPCYEKTFDSEDGRGEPPLFPPRNGKLVTVTLRVPGQQRIAVRARAHHYTKTRYQTALRRLGCDS